jgi:hypothetical protein
MPSHKTARKSDQTTNLGVRGSNPFGRAIVSKGLRRMAKNDLTVGGTPGAIDPAALSGFLSIKFEFPDDVKDRLLALCTPSQQFLDDFRGTLADWVSTPEVAVIDALEACGRRFLRNKVHPISKAEQKRFLQAIEAYSEALKSLFVSTFEFDHSQADPFLFLERAGRERGDRRTRRDHWSETVGMLTMLNFFAKWQLARKLEPAPDDDKERVRRKTEYPRLVLIADLLAAYQRITGLAPTAYAQRPKDNIKNVRRVSAAVDFISVAVPPIMEAARLRKHIDDQTIKNEIAAVKRFWDHGRRPEREYVFPDW